MVAMVSVFLPLVLAGQALALQDVEEPDGSHTVGVVPSYHGRLKAPASLRGRSCAMAGVACRHYVYEVYGDAKGTWLVRYLSLPSENEPFPESEQAFLFPCQDCPVGEEIASKDIRYTRNSATWRGVRFELAERRDLMKER